MPAGAESGGDKLSSNNGMTSKTLAFMNSAQVSFNACIMYCPASVAAQALIASAKHLYLLHVHARHAMML